MPKKFYSWNFKNTNRIPSKRFLVSISIFGSILLLIDLSMIFYYLNVFYFNILLRPSYFQNPTNYNPPGDVQKALYSAWILTVSALIVGVIIIILSYFKVDSIEVKGSNL